MKTANAPPEQTLMGLIDLLLPMHLGKYLSTQLEHWFLLKHMEIVNGIIVYGRAKSGVTNNSVS